MSSRRSSTGGHTCNSDAVPVETALRWPWRLELADAGDRLEQHPLELRQRDHSVLVVAHRGQVANLGQGEQPLVVGVVARPGVEQVDIVACGEPLDREVPQSGEPQPGGHQRVHARAGSRPRRNPSGDHRNVWCRIELMRSDPDPTPATTTTTRRTVAGNDDVSSTPRKPAASSSASPSGPVDQA